MSIARRRRSSTKAETAVQHRGLPINPEKLKRAMHGRGLSARRLSEIAKVSQNTISHAMAGRPVAAETLRKIARALTRFPLLESVDELLDVS